MKTEKKRAGTKAEIRDIRERQRHIAKAMFLVFILLIVVFSSYFTYNFLYQPQDQTTDLASSQLKAAIVDQLSLTFPNQTFIETATNILEQAGYNVDYYPGEQVTVESFRRLSKHNYGLIILRVHTTATGPSQKQAPVAFFTSERVDTKQHVYEQLTSQLVMVAFSSEEFNKGIRYFGISPPFITEGMKERFRNTVVIAMGCQSLENTLMAEAFVEKGAGIYVGWDGEVSASHTDTVTTQLLQNFLKGKLTLKVAVIETLQEVGSDSSYDNRLTYYPFNAGEQTIENFNGTS